MVALVGDPDLGEHRLGLGGRVGLGAAEHVHLRRRHVLQHGHMLPEIELLEDHRELGADAVDLLHVGGRRPAVARRHLDQLALDPDLAAVRRLEEVDAAQEGRLARSRRAEDRDHVMLVRRQRNALEHVVGAEGLADGLDVERDRRGVGDPSITVVPPPSAAPRRRPARRGIVNPIQSKRIGRRASRQWCSASRPGQILQNRAVRPVVAVAALDQPGERRLHRPELGDLALDPLQMLARQLLDVGAGPPAVLVEREKPAAILDAEAQRPGAREEGEDVEIALAEGAVAVRPALRPDQADLLV